MNDQKDKFWPMLTKLGVTMKSEEELMGKALMKRVMQNWLPAATALLEMMIFHLPSPHTAQRYRVENLYEGPLDDVYANAIRNCDPDGPLMIYVSKMIPASDKGRFFAFGRVFAGKVSTGLKVRIMGPNYVPGEKKDLYVKSVQRTVIWMGKKQETVEDVPCGNTVAMVGLDQFITKNATLTNEKEVDAHPIRAMKFSVSPVVCVAVQCKVASDLPKLVEARPMEDGLAEAIDEGRIGPRDDPKVRGKILAEEFGWDKDLVKKIWCFGQETTGPNMVVDMCKGVQYLNEIKDSVVAGFQWATKEGVGMCLRKWQRPGTPLYNIKAYLPVVESFGFSGALRASTSGQAFPQCVFDHWDMMSSDPLEAGSQASTLVAQIRKRKGLKEQMTPLSEFEDKL
ncbi:hypothetical protein L1987_73925 [Smallanthus sonchifolius]|uniref:Uncharacterized protein n=1 Tax=Smallanthus sonchifolius TaxID=185202 RepID=A0ACB9A170_9ASTR|nr:hypothetical protein L1987_73925 [Smallanthus sonchifolius]